MKIPRISAILAALFAAAFPPAAVRADMLVQRGVTQLQYNTTEPPVANGPAEAIVNLATPVEAGKSFVIASARCAIGGWEGTKVYLTTAELINIVDGKYTQLRFYKRSTQGNRLVRVEWQVVSGDEFRVQSGLIQNFTGFHAYEAVAAVNTNNAFLFFTANAWDSEWRRLYRGMINSPEQVQFSRGSGSNYQVDIAWYLVEWRDARVRHGTTTLGAAADTVTSSLATPASLDKAFMFFSYSLSDEPVGEKQLNVRGRFTAPGEIEFKRHEPGPQMAISWFVVEHDKIQVSSGLASMAAGEADMELHAFASDPTKAFVPLGYLGNAYCDAASADFALCRGLETQQMEMSGDPPVPTLAIRRAATAGSLHASWFIVNKHPPKGTVVRFF